MVKFRILNLNVQSPHDNDDALQAAQTTDSRLGDTPGKKVLQLWLPDYLLD